MKYHKKRHDVCFAILKPIALLINLIVGFKRENTYKIKKGESIVVLSNHQTDIDGICLGTCFNKTMYYVATDSVLVKRFSTSLLNFALAPIPKRKGVVDVACVSRILKTAKENGNICLFAEGNRTYAEFQFYIGLDTIKLLRHLKKTIVIFNFHGGTGVRPRFAFKKRKGKFTGGIKRVIPFEEYNALTDEELLNLIKNELRVYDSESNEKYISDKRAEYLESMFFVCPKCGKTETLVSNGNYIECKECGLKVEFTEDLKLKSDDPKFKFKLLNDWYQYQKEFVKNMKIKDRVNIFSDNNVKIFISNPYQKRKLISKGKMSLTTKTLKFENFSIPISEIHSASPVSGRKIQISTEKENYLIKGAPRFNPLKYVLMFNKLDTYMKLNNLDNYYNLD